MKSDSLEVVYYVSNTKDANDPNRLFVEVSGTLEPIFTGDPRQAAFYGEINSANDLAAKCNRVAEVGGIKVGEFVACEMPLTDMTTKPRLAEVLK